MMEFTLASGNAHKAQEFSELFDSAVIKVSAAPAKLEVDETGTSYFENAFIKAKAYYDQFKKPVLADDSGLTVLALPEELGIYSARFGGAGLTDKERVELLLKKLEGERNREAFFTCVLCFYLSHKEIFYFEGRLAGSIGYSYRGEMGFGYDPVFIPAGAEGEQTVAELGYWKNKNSHRAIAVSLAQKFFASRS